MDLLQLLFHLVLPTLGGDGRVVRGQLLTNTVGNVRSDSRRTVHTFIAIQGLELTSAEATACV